MSTMSSVSRKGLYGLILFLVPAIHCAQDSDWPEKDDFQQSYTLAPGSQVEVKAINGSVTIENVASHCHATDVAVDVPGIGRVVGDVAYGGNWFFLTHIDQAWIDLEHARDLTRLTQSIQDALRAAGITGANGADIDHIELSAPPSRPDADARNFVLCSGGEYDRSPCGTGTSAVMAARHRRGELALGQHWRQESVAGSLFTGWLTAGPGGVLVPHVRGTAFVTGEATLRFDPHDPFRGGLGRT